MMPADREESTPRHLSLGMLVDRTSFDETDSFGIDTEALDAPWRDDISANKYSVMKNGRVKRRLRWRPKKKKSLSPMSCGDSVAPSVASKTSHVSHTSFASVETVKKGNRSGPRGFFSRSSLQQVPEVCEMPPALTTIEYQTNTNPLVHATITKDPSGNSVTAAISSTRKGLKSSASATGSDDAGKNSSVGSEDVEVKVATSPGKPPLAKKISSSPKGTQSKQKNHRSLFRRKASSPKDEAGGGHTEEESEADSSFEANDSLPSLEVDLNRRVDLRLPEEEVIGSNQSVASSSSRYRIQPPPSSRQKHTHGIDEEMEPFRIESLEYIPEEDEREVLSPLPSFENESRFSMNDIDDISTLLTKSSDSNSQNNSCPVDLDEATFHEAEKNLQAIHEMGAEHLKYREYDEALEVFEEILRSQLTRHGPWHHRVGTALHNIGIVHMKTGNSAKAIKSCKEAIAVRKKVLGENHMDVADSLSQLGVCYLEARKNAKAVESFREALKIRRLCVGQKHPKVAKILNNIGCALYEMNELEIANIAFEEALNVQRGTLRSVAADSADISDQSLLSIACTLSNIGSIQLYWRNFEKATKALEEALMIQQSVLGDTHPLSRRTMESLAWIRDIDISSSSDLAENTDDENYSIRNVVPHLGTGSAVIDSLGKQLEFLRTGLELTCFAAAGSDDETNSSTSWQTNRVHI